MPVCRQFSGHIIETWARIPFSSILIALEIARWMISGERSASLNNHAPKTSNPKNSAENWNGLSRFNGRDRSRKSFFLNSKHSEVYAAGSDRIIRSSVSISPVKGIGHLLPLFPWQMRKPVYTEVSSHKIQVTRFKLQDSSHKIQVARFKLQVSSCKFQVTT